MFSYKHSVILHRWRCIEFCSNSNMKDMYPFLQVSMETFFSDANFIPIIDKTVSLMKKTGEVNSANIKYLDVN